MQQKDHATEDQKGRLIRLIDGCGAREWHGPTLERLVRSPHFQEELAEWINGFGLRVPAPLVLDRKGRHSIQVSEYFHAVSYKGTDEASFLISSVDFSGFTKEANFLHGFNGNENGLTGKKQLERLSSHAIVADAEIAMKLLEEDEQATLMFIEKKFSVRSMQFLGTVFRKGTAGPECTVTLSHRPGKNHWTGELVTLDVVRKVEDLVLCLNPNRVLAHA